VRTLLTIGSRLSRSLKVGIMTATVPVGLRGPLLMAEYAFR
jgi:hypothetical protein